MVAFSRGNDFIDIYEIDYIEPELITKVNSRIKRRRKKKSYGKAKKVQYDLLQGQNERWY